MSSGAQVCIQSVTRHSIVCTGTLAESRGHYSHILLRTKKQPRHCSSPKRQAVEGSELTAQTLPSPVPTFFKAPLNAATGSSDPLSLLDLVFHTGFEERLLLGLLLAEPLYRPHPFPSPTSCDPKLLARLCVLGARAAPLVLARASVGGLTSADQWRASSVVRDRRSFNLFRPKLQILR